MKNKIVKLIIFAIVVFAEVIIILGSLWFLLQFTKIVFANEKLQTEEYVVSPGETLWDIAAEYKKEGQDIRRYIYELRELNDIDNCIIYPNQVIKIIK